MAMRMNEVLLAVLAAGALALGCSRSEAAPAKKEAPPGNDAVETATAKIDGKNFKLEIKSAGPCTATTECKGIITLDALSEFHINKEYPYKFTAKVNPDVEFLGKEGDQACAGGKTIFSKCAGDFKQEGEQRATLGFRFKPAKAGPLTVVGTYKMSVCSAQNCQLETHELALDLTVDPKK